jgi:hypothetical protein
VLSSFSDNVVARFAFSMAPCLLVLLVAGLAKPKAPWIILLLIPALIFAVWAQKRLKEEMVCKLAVSRGWREVRVTSLSGLYGEYASFPRHWRYHVLATDSSHNLIEQACIVNWKGQVVWQD